MDTQQTTHLIASASALMERFERRTQQIESSLQAAHQQLHQLTQQLPEAVHRAADMEMQKLRSNVVGVVDAGIGQSVSTYESRLHAAGQQLQQASHALSTQLHGMRQLHRLLIWKVTGICLASLALILLGGSWMSSHYYDEIRRHQVAADLLRAYDGADVALCGDALCANVDPKGKTFGDAGQYRPVRARR